MTAHTYNHPPIASSEPKGKCWFPVLVWHDPATLKEMKWTGPAEADQGDAFHAAIGMLSKLLDKFYKKGRK